MRQKEFKEKLKKIKTDNYIIPKDQNLEVLTDQMLENIGVSDPQLRDELIYEVMSKWILDDIYSKTRLKQILKICLNKDHLYFKLGEKADDSVLTRSFSALIIAVLIHKDNQTDFLTQCEFDNAFKKIIDYYKNEKDLRGYLKDKGWAHSAAHGADMIKELGENNKAKQNLLLESLNTVIYKAQIDDYIYFNGEDERIAKAVKSVIKNSNLEDDEIQNWFKNLVEIKDIANRNKKDTLIFNLKNILKSLYFELLSDQKINNKYLILITNSLNKLDEKRF